MNINVLDACKGIVMNTGRALLIMEVVPGIERIYLTGDVRLKSREVLYSEVRDAQDVTTLITNVGTNFSAGISERELLERCQSIPRESFKWGHDRYLWITGVQLNENDEENGRMKTVRIFGGR